MGKENSIPFFFPVWAIHRPFAIHSLLHYSRHYQANTVQSYRKGSKLLGMDTNSPEIASLLRYASEMQQTNSPEAMKSVETIIQNMLQSSAFLSFFTLPFSNCTLRLVRY